MARYNVVLYTLLAATRNELCGSLTNKDLNPALTIRIKVVWTDSAAQHVFGVAGITFGSDIYALSIVNKS